jgi:hypothetical protein
MVRSVTVVAVLLAGGLLAAGCGQKSDSNPQSTPSASGTPSGTPSGSGSATPSGSGGTGTPAALPESCADVLTLDELDQAAGKPLPGQTLYIKGQAEPKIKRTGRVTCRYGVRKVGHRDSVPLEVGVSAYSDATSASDRVDFTVNSQRGNGAQASDFDGAGGVKGTVLITGDNSTAVFAKGTSTVAISLNRDSGLTGDKAKDALIKMAAAVGAHLP